MDASDRQIETAAAIARLQVSVSGIEGQVAGGFERLTDAVERIEKAVAGHGFAIKQLQSAEKQHARRAGAVVKWAAGIAAGVTVGTIMFMVKR